MVPKIGIYVGEDNCFLKKIIKRRPAIYFMSKNILSDFIFDVTISRLMLKSENINKKI